MSVEGKRAWQLANENKRKRPTLPRGTSLPNVHLLPQYDCYILGSRFGRERIISEAARRRISGYGRGRFEGATGVPILLVDGMVAGIWDRIKRGKLLTVRVEAFITLDGAHRRALELESQRIGKFFGMNAALELGVL